MSEMGMAIMGAALATGENRAEEAARRAIASPLLEDISIRGAKGVLINITGGADLTLHEVNEAATLIQEEADEEANIIFGAVIDETLGDELRITVIATGFGEEEVLQPPTVGKPSLSALRGGVGLRSQQPGGPPRKVVHYGSFEDLDVPTWQRKRQAEHAATPAAAPAADGEDKYDIPAFLRKHAN
jgi:cell division protein FtsZ